MTFVQIAIHDSLVMLANAVNALDDEMYSRPLPVFSSATIGQHVRHVIDMFHCLDRGYETGLVNYAERERNTILETDRDFVKKQLYLANTNINKPDKKIVLETRYTKNRKTAEMVNSNLHRELLYLLDHTIHHMALIKIGIMQVSPIKLPAEFGVAPSTLLNKQLNTAE